MDPKQNIEYVVCKCLGFVVEIIVVEIIAAIIVVEIIVVEIIAVEISVVELIVVEIIPEIIVVEIIPGIIVVGITSKLGLQYLQYLLHNLCNICFAIFALRSLQSLQYLLCKLRNLCFVWGPRAGIIVEIILVDTRVPGVPQGYQGYPCCLNPSCGQVGQRQPATGDPASQGYFY